MGVRRRVGGLQIVPERRTEFTSGPSAKKSSFAKTLMTSFAPVPDLLLKLLSSPRTSIRPASSTSAAFNRLSRAMTFIRSAVPERRRVSSVMM